MKIKYEKILKKIRKLGTIFVCSKVLFFITTPVVYAVEENENPLAIINNLSDFIFQIVWFLHPRFLITTNDNKSKISEKTNS